MSIHHLREPEKVKLIVALTFSDMDAFDEAKAKLVAGYGVFESESSIFPFDHTDYYQKEMGEGLRKQFLAFKRLYAIDCFIELKLLSLRLETEYTHEGKRTVNIDPGYLELSKVVLASTKNFDHRIHIDKGIYGDIQLRYRKGQFVPFDWTYPDYRAKLVLDFFHAVRKTYASQLKQGQ
jgi:hypothetical protein